MKKRRNGQINRAALKTQKSILAPNLIKKKKNNKKKEWSPRGIKVRKEKWNPTVKEQNHKAAKKKPSKTKKKDAPTDGKKPQRNIRSAVGGERVGRRGTSVGCQHNRKGEWRERGTGAELGKTAGATKELER